MEIEIDDATRQALVGVLRAAGGIAPDGDGPPDTWVLAPLYHHLVEGQASDEAGVVAILAGQAVCAADYDESLPETVGEVPPRALFHFNECAKIDQAQGEVEGVLVLAQDGRIFTPRLTIAIEMVEADPADARAAARAWVAHGKVDQAGRTALARRYVDGATGEGGTTPPE